MSSLDWAVALITAAAVAATLTVLIYGFFQPWYKSMFGWAFMVDGVSFAVLLDMSLISYWTHWDVPTYIELPLYGFIAAGCWMLLGVVVFELIRSLRESGLIRSLPGSGLIRRLRAKRG